MLYFFFFAIHFGAGKLKTKQQRKSDLVLKSEKLKATTAKEKATKNNKEKAI